MIGLLQFVLVAFLFSNAFAQISRNDEFSAQVVTGGEAKNLREHNTWSVYVRGKDGAVRYQLVKEIAFDVQFPAVYLADNGAAVVASVFEGAVEFYDSRGNLIAARELFGKRTAEHEQIIKASVAGEHVALLYSTPSWSFAKVAVMNLAGEELWSVPLRGRHAAEVFLSADERYIVAGSYTMESNLKSSTQLLDLHAKQLHTYDGAFRLADISPDDRIALADRNSVRLFQISNSVPAFVWTTNQKEEILTSLRIVNGHVVAVMELVVMESGIPTYKKPTLIVFDSKGSIVTQSALNTSSQHTATLVVGTKNITISSGSAKKTIALSEFD